MLGRGEGGLGGGVQRTKEGMHSLSGNVQGREGKRSQRCQRALTGKANTREPVRATGSVL